VTSNAELRTAVGLEIVLRDRPEAMGLLDLVNRLYHLDVLIDIMAWEPSMYELMPIMDDMKSSQALQDRGVPSDLRSFHSTVRSISYNSPVNIVIDLHSMLFTGPIAVAGLLTAAQKVLKLVDKYTDTLERHAAGQANVQESDLRKLIAEEAIKEFLHEGVTNAKDLPLTKEEAKRFDENTHVLVRVATDGLEDIEEATIIEEATTEKSPEGL
jgi:hypothetical protein